MTSSGRIDFVTTCRYLLIHHFWFGITQCIGRGTILQLVVKISSVTIIQHQHAGVSIPTEIIWSSCLYLTYQSHELWRCWKSPQLRHIWT